MGISEGSHWLKIYKKNYIFGTTMFENYSKCRIWIFQFWNFHQFFAFWTLNETFSVIFKHREWYESTKCPLIKKRQSTLERYGIFLSRLFCNVDLLWSKQQKQHFVGKTQSLFSHKQALQVMKCPLGAKAREIWSHIFPTTLA